MPETIAGAEFAEIAFLVDPSPDKGLLSQWVSVHVSLIEGRLQSTASPTHLRSSVVFWSPELQIAPGPSLPHERNIAELASVHQFAVSNIWRVQEAPISIDFSVPSVVTHEARSLLTSLPRKPVEVALDALRSWLADQPRVERIRVLSITDPESSDWIELVFEVVADVDVTQTVELWTSLSAAITQAKKKLAPHDVSVINRSLGFHIVTPAEAQGLADL